MTEIVGGAIQTTKPPADRVEVSVFGPGFGECIVVHLGDDQWMIVDSCIGKGHREPAALEYLDAIGVKVETAVKLIVATHWHDDHVRGMARILERASDAKFWGASALRSDEFLALTSRRDLASRFTSGVDELGKVMDIVNARSAAGGESLGEASAARRIWLNPPAAVSEVWCLSPSDEDIAVSRSHIASLLPANPVGVARIPVLDPNDTSVVLVLITTSGAVLLGGDLEHRPSSETRGWHAVVGLASAPTFAAGLFKVPHHGSENAHCDRVWDQLIDGEAYCAVTPFERGVTPLPRASDRARIRARTPFGFLTSDKRGRAPQRDRVTEKTIREATRAFDPETLLMGQVQLRSDTDGGWALGLSEEAAPL